MPTIPNYDAVGYKFDLKVQGLSQGGDTLFGRSFSIADRNDNNLKFDLTEREDDEAGIYEYAFPDTNNNAKWSHFFIYDNDYAQPLYDGHYQNLTVPTQLPLPFNSGGLTGVSYHGNSIPMSYLTAFLGTPPMLIYSDNTGFWDYTGIERIPISLANFFKNGTLADSALSKGTDLDSFYITNVSKYPFNLSSEAAQDSDIHKLKVVQNTSDYNQNAGNIMAYTQGNFHSDAENRYIKAPIANITSHDDIQLIEDNIGVLYMGKNLQDITNPTAEVFNSFGAWLIYRDHDGVPRRAQISYTDYTSGISTAWSGEEGSGVVVE